MTKAKAIMLICEEVVKAEIKHPKWPKDPIHAVAIMMEECGEAVQAAIDFTYQDGTDRHINREALRKELAQAGAMAIRNLIHLDTCQPVKSEQE